MNVATLAANSPTLQAYREAVTKMQKELPPGDGRSWAFQANMHGSTQDADKLWGWCQHKSWWFLPWHRGYLFFFERIIREVARAPEFALPYWKWEEQGADTLPPAFLDRQSPLYDSTRFKSVNDGHPLTPTNRADPKYGTLAAGWELARTSPRFLSRVANGSGFGGPVIQPTPPMTKPQGSDDLAYGDLEKHAHNKIHTFVAPEGGNMYDPLTAARDPIFWLHHANVDRLWSRWLGEQGHRNPTDARWLGQTFPFVDADGSRVIKSVADILAMAADGVRYDDDRPPAFAAALPPEPKGNVVPPVETRVAAAVPQFVLGNLPFEKPLSLDPGGKPKLVGALGAVGGAPPAPESVVLRVEGIKPPAGVGVTYDLYVTRQGVPPTAPYLVGSLTFFGAGKHTHHHAGGGRGYTEVFDATAVLARIRRESGGDLPEVGVSILPHSNDPAVSDAELAKRPPAGVPFTAVSLRVVTEEDGK